MKKTLIDQSIPLEAHTSYPAWSHRMANNIITIDGVQYQKCVKCGETKPLSEFYSYFYYTNKKERKKKYKNSCKKCHIKVVMEKRNSDIKFVKLHNLYNANVKLKKQDRAGEQDKRPYLKYIWQKSKEAGLLHDIRNELKKGVERKEKQRPYSNKHNKIIAKKVREEKKLLHTIEQQEILDVLSEINT